MKIYILTIAFTLSAVQCQVDAQKPLFPIPPLFNAPDENFPLLNIPEDQESHIYTEEQQQIRQNLIGNYEGICDNQPIRIHIRNNYLIYVMSDDVACQLYYVHFLTHSTPTITFQAFGTVWDYTIELSPHSNNVIGLRSLLGNLEIELMKKPNQQSHDHQEL